VARIPSLKNLWRFWLRNESPRRSLIRWSGADKAVLTVICFSVALISSWHLLQVPDLKAGMPAPSDEIAPKDAEVIYRDSQQQNSSERIQDTIFVQVIDKSQSTALKELLKKKLRKIELLAISNDADRIAPANLSNEEETWLLNSSKSSRKRWREEIELAANRMLKQGLVNTIGFDELKEAASLQLADSGEKVHPSRTLGSKLLARTFHRNTNLRQDRSLQGLLEDTITKQSPPIKVRAGDHITRKGEEISPQDYFVLEHYNLVPKSPRMIRFLY